jgi:hypothetical protein
MKPTQLENLQQIRLIGPEELATLLQRNVATLKVDCRRKPESLPPRLEIPGCKRLLWLESDVLTWLEGLRCPTRRRSKF